MKILLVADKLVYDGRTSYALSLAQGLKEAGHTVQCCVTGGELRARLDELKIEHFLVKHNVFSFHRLVGFLKEFGPDLLHVTSERSLPPGRRIARGLRTPYLVTVHDLLDAEDLTFHTEELLGIIVANEGLREFLVNRMYVPKEYIGIIPKGVDLDAFDVPYTAMNTRLPVVGCVGRFVPGKGQDVFLRAARRVLDAGHEALFLLVGTGREEKRLRKLIHTLDLAQAVTISAPIIAARDIYRAMDIVVLPALKASSSLTALEAMAARRPVIASVVGDLLHLVKNEENCLAVEPGNVEGLTAAIGRLLAQPTSARTLAEHARETVAQRYPLSRMLESTAALYAEILAGDFPRR